MGIQVEFNPDLALRNFSHYKEGKRKEEECVPENLEVGKTYSFLKSGQRNYWLQGEIPLLETEGEGILSKPLASIKIVEVNHTEKGGEISTTGKYEVVEVFNDDKVHFDGFAKI